MKGYGLFLKDIYKIFNQENFINQKEVFMDMFFGEQLFVYIGNQEIFSEKDFEKIFSKSYFLLRCQTPVSIPVSVSLSSEDVVSQELFIETCDTASYLDDTTSKMSNFSECFPRISADGTKIFPTHEKISQRKSILKKSRTIIFECEDLEKRFIFTFTKNNRKKWKLHTSIQLQQLEK